MTSLSIIGWGLALWGLLFLSGAGWAVALLGERNARLWPALAAPLGLAVLVVASDVPAFLFGARTWAIPLGALLLLASLGLAWRHRARLRHGDLTFVPFMAFALLLGLWPQLSEGLATTLSRGNHDYAFYQVLAESLLVRGYANADVDLLSATDTTAWVLRHGGWRSGLTHLTAGVCAVTGRPAWSVDGVLWAAVYSTLPAAALAAFGLVRPGGSLPARLAVGASGALLSGPLMLLRDTFASHLASLPLLVLLTAGLLRALTSRALGPRVLVVLTLAASLSVLPDEGPLLVAVVASLAGLLLRARPRLRWRIVDRTLALGAFAVALVPCAVARVVWQLESLSFTGYLGARGASAGGKDVLSGDVLQLVPTLLGLGTRSWLVLRTDYAALVAAVAVGCVAGLVALTSLKRLRGRPAVLFAALALAYFSVLGLLQLTDKHYPAWKTALSMSAFVPLLLGLAIEFAPKRRALLGWAAIYLAGLVAVGVYDEQRPDTRVGILTEHVELARRLDALPGELFLVGNLGSERTLRWELPLQLLLSARGRHLNYTPHPYSYFRLASPTKVYTGGPAVAVSLSSADADLAGPVLFQTGPVEVRDLSAPGARALNFGFDAQWYAPEREPDRRFRWSRIWSRALVDFRGVGCWVFEARGLVPGGTLVIDREGAPWRFELSPEWHTFRLPARGVATAWLDFDYQGPSRQIEGESRELRFALADPHWEAGCTGP